MIFVWNAQDAQGCTTEPMGKLLSVIIFEAAFQLHGKGRLSLLSERVFNSGQWANGLSSAEYGQASEGLLSSRGYKAMTRSAEKLFEFLMVVTGRL